MPFLFSILLNRLLDRDVKMLTKKKTNVNKKPTQYPNNNTLMAYFMQAIEPNSEEINKAFPGYHPLWVQRSQKLSPSGTQFAHYRQNCLSMTQMQCAAYLRVSVRQIKLWELDRQSVPFMAFELLRLVHESAHFRLSHQDWAGWFISENGRLVCPERGNLSFEPMDLTMVRDVQNANRVYLSECKKAQAKVADLEEELAALKTVNYEDELLTEVSDIHLKIKVLLNRMNEARSYHRIRRKSTHNILTTTN